MLVALALVSVGVDADPAFELRGIKGLWWKGIENYRRALPWVAEHRLNFLMLCYSSFPASGTDWRADYTDEEMRQLRELAADARRMRVHLCLSFNPGIWSKPPLVHSSEDDYQAAIGKVRKVHALGIDWFALCLDDISRELQPADKERFGTLQAAQTHFVNRLWHDMRQLKPRPKLIFCPSAYTTEDARQHLGYIKAIGRDIDPEVMMFWTGPQCCSASISAADAREFGQWIRREPFVWDNYPVNDMYAWRPLMGPVKNRSADLGDAVCGYLANPMKQWSLNPLPLSTTAAYLNDPGGYDASAEIERAIRSYPADQQRAVRLLVHVYGSSFWGEPGFPPKPQAGSREDALKLLPKYRALRRELSGNPGLAEMWSDLRPTIEQDIAVLERKTRDRLAESPLKASGDDFAGGAGDVFGYFQRDRGVNYVYARPTGRDEMHVEFSLANVPATRAKLRLVAMDGDTGVTSRVRISMNDTALFEGVTGFGHDGFSERNYSIPAATLRPGRNLLSIRNLEGSGVLGMPPWFMVAEAEIVIPRT